MITANGSGKQQASIAIVGVFTILLFGTLWVAQSFFIPVTVSILLALVFSPVRRSCSSIGIPASLFSFAVVFMLLVGLVCLAIVFSSTIYSKISDFPELVQVAGTRLQELLGLVQPIVEATDKLSSLSGEQQEIETVALQQPGVLALLTETTPVAIGQILFCLALTFFLIASGDMFYEKLIEDLPSLKDKKRALKIATDTERLLSTYFLTISIINAVTAMLIGLLFWWLGMPNPVLFAVMAFVLNFIPYVGPIFGIFVSLIVGIVGFDSFLAASIPAFSYWAINTLEGQFATPFFVGRRMKLSPVFLFLFVALWAWLWGVIGMFLATPILIAIKCFCDHTPQFSSVGTFLGARETPTRQNSRLLKHVFRRTETAPSQDIH